ncbi:AbrB/MazE/SpoVT family DNA-binding domain-containing protein [Phaeodactylibacter sp.]|uniref:AbrB/MazE/SpoVT family DNA-binding domain-containing protein n=1 Tax=Phaeodactylibacter sp. TaxID=1940289 RepID=UPI0032EC5774
MEVKIDKFGRILIPKKVREELGLKAGQYLEIGQVNEQEGIYLKKQPVAAPQLTHSAEGFPFFLFEESLEQEDAPDAASLIKTSREERDQKIMGL